MSLFRIEKKLSTGLSSSVSSAVFGLPQGTSSVTYSAEAAAVHTRLGSLVPSEKTAIATFVDGLVADGEYANVIDFWAYAVGNAAASLKGFKTYDLTTSGTISKGSQGYTRTGSGGCNMSTNIATVLGSNYGHIGSYIGADTTSNLNSNVDYFGCDGATNDTSLRFRGNDTLDFNSMWGDTSFSPRPITLTRLENDIIALGSVSGDINVLWLGDSSQSSIKTDGTLHAALPISFGGRNNNGSLGAGGGNYVQSCSFVLNASADVPAIRTRILTLLTDLGVSNVPTP